MRFTNYVYGESFTWEVVDADGQSTEREYHAKFGLDFEERLQWAQEHALLLQETAFTQKALADLIAGIDETNVDPELFNELRERAEQVAIEEAARFPREITQTLRLVADDDGTLAEALKVAPVHLIRELRDWLKSVVVDRTAARVQAVADVPPTLPPPPTSSPDTTSGGLPSDDAGSSSTDSPT